MMRIDPGRHGKAVPGATISVTLMLASPCSHGCVEVERPPDETLSEGLPPVTVLTPGSTVVVGQSLYVSANNSYDQNAGELRYSWVHSGPIVLSSRAAYPGQYKLRLRWQSGILDGELDSWVYQMLDAETLPHHIDEAVWKRVQ